MHALLLSAVLLTAGVTATYIGKTHIEWGAIVTTEDGTKLACGLDFLPKDAKDHVVYLHCVDFVNTRPYIGDNVTGAIEEGNEWEPSG